MAQRVHRERSIDGSVNARIFLLILQLVARHEEIVIKYYFCFQNLKYNSHHIQNDVIDIHVGSVRQSILDEVR